MCVCVCVCVVLPNIPSRNMYQNPSKEKTWYVFHVEYAPNSAVTSYKADPGSITCQRLVSSLSFRRLYNVHAKLIGGHSAAL